MSADITALDLHWRRRSLLFYPVGLALYALAIVAIYPSFRNDSSLDALTKDSKLYAMFGVNGPLTSPTGWLNANLYGNFVPLIVLLATIGYGASALAGQNEDGTLGLVATLPVSRRSLVWQKFAAMCAIAAPVSIATFGCVLAGRGFELTVPVDVLAEISLAVMLLGAVFGTLALLLGALSGSRSLALGIASGLAAAMYLVSSLAPAVSGVHAIRWMSPFYWAVGNGQIAIGLGWAEALALVLTTLALLGAAVLAGDRMDIR